MTTKKERAQASAEWLKDATPQQIVERIEASELNSLLWDVATLTMTRDEIVSEIPEGWGSIEEFERIVTTPPEWAREWPIKAPGGWRAKRYRKG